MAVATMTSKGQVTLPKEIRDQLNLSAGDKIDFVVGDGREVRLLPRNKSIWDLKGKLKRPGQKPVSLEDMDKAIIAGIAGRVLHAHSKVNGTVKTAAKPR